MVRSPKVFKPFDLHFVVNHIAEREEFFFCREFFFGNMDGALHAYAESR